MDTLLCFLSSEIPSVPLHHCCRCLKQVHHDLNGFLSLNINKIIKTETIHGSEDVEDTQSLWHYAIYCMFKPAYCNQCNIFWVSNTHLWPGNTSTPPFPLCTLNQNMTNQTDHLFERYQHNTKARQYFCEQFKLYYTTCTTIPPSWMIHLNALSDEKGALYTVAHEHLLYLVCSTGHITDGVQTCFGQRFVTSFLELTRHSVRALSVYNRGHFHPVSSYASKIDAIVRGIHTFIISPEETSHFLKIFTEIMPYVRCSTDHIGEYNAFSHTAVEAIASNVRWCNNHDAHRASNDCTIKKYIADTYNYQTCWKCNNLFYLANSTTLNMIVHKISISITLSRLWFYEFLNRYIKYMVCQKIDVNTFSPCSTLKQFINI